MAKKKKSLSIETNDQNFGGSFNAHKNWKKLREKHRKSDEHKAKTGKRNWKPEVYTSTGAGKGDRTRSTDIPDEIYGLNYDLAFGKITKEEHEKMVQKFWEDQD